MAASWLATAMTLSQAGTLAGGQWTSTACGARPEAPALDVRNTDAYNRSVDLVNAYLLAVRPYFACLVKEANADFQTISQAATAAQQSIKEASDKVQADMKAANDKLK